ncbi:hypothetical protein RCIP0019_00056 [Klebsiella phage RCIP0019]
MQIPYPSKTEKFLGLVVVEIINPNIRNAEDEPTLEEWAGIKEGDRFTCEAYEGGFLWAQVGKCYQSEDWGVVSPVDWFELNEGEYKVIEE